MPYGHNGFQGVCFQIRVLVDAKPILPVGTQGRSVGGTVLAQVALSGNHSALQLILNPPGFSQQPGAQPLALEVSSHQHGKPALAVKSLYKYKGCFRN